MQMFRRGLRVHLEGFVGSWGKVVGGKQLFKNKTMNTV